MIQTINIKNIKNAKAVLSIQFAAYRVEADIIGSTDIPLLKDNIDALQRCEETFIGSYINNQLCGVLSFKMKHNVLDIHRLIVDPKHFRKGIGKALLAYIESEYKP